MNAVSGRTGMIDTVHAASAGDVEVKSRILVGAVARGQTVQNCDRPRIRLLRRLPCSHRRAKSAAVYELSIPRYPIKYTTRRTRRSLARQSATPAEHCGKRHASNPRLASLFLKEPSRRTPLHASHEPRRTSPKFVNLTSSNFHARRAPNTVGTISEAVCRALRSPNGGNR